VNLAAVTFYRMLRRYASADRVGARRWTMAMLERGEFDRGAK
jgi:hypothetical protein